MQFPKQDAMIVKTQIGNPTDQLSFDPVAYRARYQLQHWRYMQINNAIYFKTLFPLIFMPDSISTDHESIQDRPCSRYLYKDSISTDLRQIIEYRVGCHPKRFRFFYQ